MGTNVKLTLPPGTRTGDLADAIGALLGCKIDAEAKYCPDVIGPTIERVESSISILSNIIVPTEATRWDRGVHWLLHHEWGSDSTREPNWPGSIGMMPASGPFQIAVCKRLADIFGGVVDYNDCDETDIDYQPDEPEVMRVWRTEAYTDERWNAMRRHVTVDVEPLTEAEVEACIEFASYTRPPFAKIEAAA